MKYTPLVVAHYYGSQPHGRASATLLIKLKMLELGKIMNEWLRPQV